MYIDTLASAQEFVHIWRTECKSPCRRAFHFSYAAQAQRANASMDHLYRRMDSAAIATAIAEYLEACVAEEHEAIRS